MPALCHAKAGELATSRQCRIDVTGALQSWTLQTLETLSADCDQGGGDQQPPTNGAISEKPYE
jgi:hypothetical protein